ncbi:MAG: threonine synthase [Nitrososphaeria archaeon]
MRLNGEASLLCVNCGWRGDPEELRYTCPRCGEPLTIVYEEDYLAERARELREGRGRGVWRYSAFLPFPDDVRRVTLDEGSTPLHESKQARGLRLKNEGLNPTASFKDRGMTVAVTDALRRGASRVVCASTGNTAASVAAYAARAGMRSYVLVPSGAVARGKLAQAVAHGSKIVKIRGGFDEALREVLRLVSEDSGLYLLNSVNPYRIEGQKTLAFEVWEQLGGSVPDAVVLPVGNAGNISAIWKGFRELVEAGLARSAPRMIGVQAEGAAPLARAFEGGLSELRPVDSPQTYATAIRIGRPASWRRALMAARESRGAIISVSDQEILRAQIDLARVDGVFVEPASAAALAGYRRAIAEGLLDPGESVVAVLTGHGLKDPDAVAMFGSDEVEVELRDLTRELSASA